MTEKYWKMIEVRCCSSFVVNSLKWGEVVSNMIADKEASVGTKQSVEPANLPEMVANTEIESD